MNLRSGRPRDGRIRSAVLHVLESPALTARAQEIRDEIAAVGDPVDRIAQRVDELVVRARAQQRAPGIVRAR